MAEPKPRQRKFAPRSRTGCLTCRTRRKRCGCEHPQCSNCQRLNLTCEWQPQRKIVAESSVSPAISTTTATTEIDRQVSSPLVPSSLSPWDALPGRPDQIFEKKHLLQYYVNAFVPSVSVATTSNSFYTQLYMPWAFKVEGMLDAILAISSAQLARRTSDLDRKQQLRALSTKHERSCYAFIKERISPAGGPYQDTYQVVATILMLVGLEALNGKNTTRWISQLQCVERILDNLPPEQVLNDCWEVDSLRRHFTYHFASASLMARVFNNASWTVSPKSLPLLNLPSIPTTVDPLMGIAYELCALISRIPSVSTSTFTFPDLSETSFNAIEQGIQSWTYASPFSLEVDLPIALDLVALAEAYRLAAIIQLYRGSPLHAPLVPPLASRAMEFIARVPSGSPAESSLLYPIFLAGAELEDEVACNRCFSRLEEIQKRNGYENIGSVQKVLKEVWRSRKEGKKKDWEDVVKAWGWSFTLG